MPDQQNDQLTAEMPEDFSAYESMRGAQLRGEEPPAEAAEEEPSDASEEAETASDSETDEEAEQEEQAEEEPAEEEQPKKKGGFQRRIDRLTREKAELADRLTRLEQQELARQSAGRPAAETSGTKQPAAPDATEPDPKDFETWEKYTAALVEHRLEQRERAKQAENERKTAEEQRKAVVAKWSEQVEKGRDEYDDFDEVVVKSRKPASPVVQQFILKSDVGYRVAHDLGSDAGLLDKINKLDAIDATRELLAIEAKYTAASKAPEQKPKVTKAPPPVKPVAGKLKAGPRLTDENLEFSDYERLRKQQLAKKRY